MNAAASPSPGGVVPGVVIAFECLPLRTISRRDPPLDASPKFVAFCHRLIAACDKHGVHNSYYLHKGVCRFQLLNHPTLGRLEFSFEGVVLTDETDSHTVSVDVQPTLVRETCDWLTAPIVVWFHETVRRAITAEFDRYIAAGDLAKTVERLAKMQHDFDEHGGYVGMYL
ncbi:MAG TPA: hypothetical protein VGE52_00490 [Pirellulales bacterium]